MSINSRATGPIGLNSISKAALVCIVTLVAFAAPTSALAAKKLVMKLVAEVDQRLITSRDVDGYSLVSKLLDGVSPTAVKDEAKGDVDQYIIETMVHGEAQSFGIAKVTDEEVDAAFKQIRAKINESPQLKTRWASLEFADARLKEMVVKHLRATKLIKYRSESTATQISDEEAKDYFEKNKVKFGSVDFESFKPNIKKFIAKKNSETRIKEWIDILKKKHKVKKLSESV